MNDLVQQRQRFAQILEANLEIYKHQDVFKRAFLQEFYKSDYPFIHPQYHLDKSLNAAWHLADEFFDAVWHGFREISYSLSVDYCETLLQHIVERFREGLSVTHPDILRFYQEPRKGCLSWRLFK